MTTAERLHYWKQSGIIDETQHSMLSALASKERFSVFLELNALLYIGVLSLAAGLGWTLETHFASLGDAFILFVLSFMLAGSLYYCFSRAPLFSTGEVESPNFGFDYAVYLSCLLLSVELGYIEFRYEWLRDAWHNYLLFSSAVFFVLAYRFDNRFVLSLALSSLAGWLGLKVSRFWFVSSETLRISGLVYAALVAVIGAFLYRQGIKKHFLETYLHIASNTAFIALIYGLSADARLIYLLGLILMSTTAIVLGVRFNRFAFVVYGTVFGYMGLSIELLRNSRDFTNILAYVVVSGAIVIVSVAMLARRFGREE
jgi:hypothetical protein